MTTPRTRIEILCSEEEKESLQRKAGNVPLGRWARIRLLGPNRTSGEESIPTDRVLGFLQTVERLALEGDLPQILDTSRAIQRHLQRSKH